MDNTKKGVKKTGLGRGLGINSLIRTADKDEEIVSGNSIVEIDINKVEPNPDQPRKQFHKESLEELAMSIQEYGIIQPILVNDLGDGFYKIVAGERRYRAARIAKLSTIPVIIKTYQEMEALQIALIENIQRQDLSPVEEALCYKQLEEYFFHKKEDIAKKVGKSRNTIAQRINLLELPEEVLDMVSDGKISASHGLKIVALDDEELMLRVATEVFDNSLSLRETGELIERVKGAVDVVDAEGEGVPVYRANPFEGIENILKDIWGTKVNIKGKGDKGKVEIEYYSKEELERVLDGLRGLGKGE